MKAAREKEKSPKPPRVKSIHEVMKENKEKFKYLDPVDEKRKCLHPFTGFFCSLCACEKVPKVVMRNAVNYGKSPTQDNQALAALRAAYKFPKSPKSPAN